MTTFDQLVQAMGDPTLAYVLMTLGVYALIYEVTHPGAVAPGVVGVIMLVVGLFGLGTLTTSLAGLVLIVFGFVLLASEVVVVPGSGLLAAGGIGSLTLGSLLLMTELPPGEEIAPAAVIAVVLSSAGFFAILGRGVLAIRRRRPRIGREAMLGAAGVALTDLNPSGQVQLHGEIWSAVVSPGCGPVAAGQPIFVVAIEGLKLTVAPSKVLAVR